MEFDLSDEHYSVVLGAGGKLSAGVLSPFLAEQKEVGRKIGRWVGVDLATDVGGEFRTIKGYDNFTGGVDLAGDVEDFGHVKDLIANANVVYNAVMFPDFRPDKNIGGIQNLVNEGVSAADQVKIHLDSMNNVLSLMSGGNGRLIQFSSNNVHNGWHEISGLNGNVEQNPPLGHYQSMLYNLTKAVQNRMVYRSMGPESGPSEAVIFDLTWPMPQDELEEVYGMSLKRRSKETKVHPDVFGEFMLRAGLMNSDKVFSDGGRVFRSQLVHPRDFSKRKKRVGWIDMSEPIERFEYNPEERFALSSKNFSRD